MLDLDDDAHALFANPRIARKLTPDARRFFVGELVKGGGAEWLADGEVGALFTCVMHQNSNR